MKIAITITDEKIRFKSPTAGEHTKRIKEHYYGRRILAEVDGEKRQFVFDMQEIPFEATEEDMKKAIEERENA